MEPKPITKEVINKLFDLLLTQGSLAMGAVLSLFSAVTWMIGGLDKVMMAFSWMFVAVVFALGLFTVQKHFKKVQEDLAVG